MKNLESKMKKSEEIRSTIIEDVANKAKKDHLAKL